MVIIIIVMTTHYLLPTFVIIRRSGSWESDDLNDKMWNARCYLVIVISQKQIKCHLSVLHHLTVF